MNRQPAGKYLWLCFAITATIIFTSCAPLSLFGPSISDIVTATGLEADHSPQGNTDTFYIDSPRICCSGRLTGAQAGTGVNIKWVYIQGAMALNDSPLIADESIVSDGDGYFGFTLQAPVSGFIAGDYEVDLALDGKPAASRIFHIRKDSSASLPHIGSFSADLSDIVAGQPVMLTWDVSDATGITIEPGIGSVPASGSRSVTPAADTTYTLYALNRGGLSSKAVTVKSSPAATTFPDLVISEFWSSGNVISYRIKNIGDAASCGCKSYLYKEDLLVSEDYVAPLSPGEERVEEFMQYHFSPRFPGTLGSSYPETMSTAIDMKICLNGDRACPESGYDNNCMEHNYGPLTTIHLSKYVSYASWQSSTANLKWSSESNTDSGWVRLSNIQMDATASSTGAIAMYLPYTSGAWLQGTFSTISGQPATLQPFTIQHKSKFDAKVGLSGRVPDNANVKFLFGIARGSEITYFPAVSATLKNKFESYDVDLSKFAGQKVEFLLRVESAEPLQQGCAAWINPVVIQEY